MKKQMIISVMSKDRPGIIAGITGAIYKLGGDLGGLNQSVLCGYLNMILAATFEATVTKEDVLAAISHVKTECRFEVSIKELSEGQAKDAEATPDETYILTVQGPNKAGIVHGISHFCYEHDINIIGLVTTLQNNQYTMALQLDLDRCSSSLDKLQKKLSDYSRENNLTILMQHNDIFEATNEVTLH